MKKDRVAIIRANDYSAVEGDIERGMTLIEFDFKKGSNIAIKPNLCAEKCCESGATVNRETIEALIRIINRRTDGVCQISIVESDSRGIDADLAFDVFDLNSLVGKYPNVRMVNLSKDATSSITFKDSPALAALEVPQTLLHADTFVSIAKLKTSSTERMTGILKNQFGCVTKKYKSIFHPFMGEVLWELNNIYKPSLCITDGIIGMEGFGPTDGVPKRAGVLLVGNNSMATDCVAARVMKFEPGSIPHLRYIMKRNRYTENDFKTVGLPISSVETKFVFVPELSYMITRIGLGIQRISTYLNNLSELMMRAASVLSLMKPTDLTNKISYKHIFKTLYDMTFKFSK